MRIAALVVLLVLAALGGSMLKTPLSGVISRAPGGNATEAGENATPRPKKDKKLVTVDPGIATALGIETATAGPGDLATEVRVVGTIGFNQDKVARIVPRVSGTVRQVLKGVGDKIAAGEALAVLDSKPIADARSSYLAARDKLSLAETTFNRENALFLKKVSPEQDLLSARRELAQARGDMRIAAQTLLTVGFREADLRRLDTAASELSRFEIVAPFAGEVVDKNVFTGELLAEDRQVFVVADLDTVWVNLQVSPEKLSAVSVGMRVTIVAGSDLSADADVTYVAPMISEETRSVHARVDLANADRRWRPGTVVDAVFRGSIGKAAVTVPSDAVQTVEGRPVVFLPVTDGFRLQAVKVGRSDGKTAEILRGIKVGDKVAAGQTFALKGELEKGAGDDDD